MYWFFIAFFNVDVIAPCPTTLSKVEGLYLRADTIKLSINSSFCRCKVTSFFKTNDLFFYIIHQIIKVNIRLFYSINEKNP